MAVYLPMIFIIILCFAEQSGKVDIRLWLYKTITQLESPYRFYYV